MSISPPSEAVRPATPDFEEEELRGISRTVAEIHWLLLILVLLYVIYGEIDKLTESAVIAACQVFLGSSFSMGKLLSLAFFGGFAAQIAPVILVAYIVSLFSADIRYGLSKAKLLSETDELTGLLNMRGFSIAANRAFGQALRYDRAVNVLMIDSDNLKAVNDTHGHGAGNQLLRQLTRVVHAELRFTDVMARYGGDEFIVLLPETPPEGAMEVAGRIRDAVANTPLDLDGKRVTCTVSIGIAGRPADGSTLDALAARADRAMYQAKQAGRNRVVQFDAAPVT